MIDEYMTYDYRIYYARVGVGVGVGVGGVVVVVEVVGGGIIICICMYIYIYMYYCCRTGTAPTWPATRAIGRRPPGWPSSYPMCV